MKKTIVLLLLFIWSSAMLHASNGEGHFSEAGLRDSLVNHFKSLPLDDRRCWQECCAYLAYSEYPWSLELLEMAIEDSRVIKDTVQLSYGLYYSLMAVNDKQDTSKVNPLLSELKSLFPDEKAELNYFRSLSWINDAYIESMNFEAAFSHLDFIEKEVQEAGLHSGLLIAWTQRANIYMKTGRYEEAIDILTIVAEDENGSDMERLTSYLAIYQAYCLKEEYDNALGVLDKATAYLDLISSESECEPNTNDTNYLLLESCYAEIWCNMKNPDKLKEHIGNMERYYVDTPHSSSYLIYHRLLASYYSMTGRPYDAEDELVKCLNYCETACTVEPEHRNLMVLDAQVKYLQGKRDSACMVYSDYLRKTESFYSESIKQQREKVMAEFYFKKGYAGREQFVNWVLKMLLGILVAGIFIFSLLLFWKSRIVLQERKVSLELNKSYLAAEQANREREEILLKIRESISKPLSIVLQNAELMNSGISMDSETKTALHSQINENAAVLNTIISDFLNKARAAAGKSRI